MLVQYFSPNATASNGLALTESWVKYYHATVSDLELVTCDVCCFLEPFIPESIKLVFLNKTLTMGLFKIFTKNDLRGLEKCSVDKGTDDLSSIP